ncbi:hypothetical protein ASF29_19095 [Rhizobium sp. Leaf262]|nr:hypothetical protein ASF29_19095 [Rhizobium sp. Leaf262]
MRAGPATLTPINDENPCIATRLWAFAIAKLHLALYFAWHVRSPRPLSKAGLLLHGRATKDDR